MPLAGTTNVSDVSMRLHGNSKYHSLSLWPDLGHPHGPPMYDFLRGSVVLSRSSWEIPGATLGPHWDQRGISLDLPGAFLGRGKTQNLEPVTRLGSPSWFHHTYYHIGLHNIRASLIFLGISWDLLETSWDPPATFMGLPGIILGPSWDPLGASCDLPGTFLGRGKTRNLEPVTKSGSPHCLTI